MRDQPQDLDLPACQLAVPPALIQRFGWPALAV